MDRCYALIRAGRYEDARQRLLPIVADHPGWARAHFFLALAYHKDARYEQARPLFERAMALDPQLRTILPFYGWCLYYLGEAEQSRKQFEAYLKVDPKHADAHFAIGLIELDCDDIPAARDRFETTIRLAKAVPDRSVEGKGHALLGDVYMRLGELERARQELQLAVQLRPDAYEAYFMLSRVLQRLGDNEGAAKARAMHQKIREMKHPTRSPMGRPESAQSLESP